MKIIVIDNDWNEALRLIDLLREAFSDSTVLPEQELVFQDWSQATSYIKSISDEVAVVCLDLSLEDRDEADAGRGVTGGTSVLVSATSFQWPCW